MLIVIMGAYFNIFITFHNASMMFPIIVYVIEGLYSHSYGIQAFMAVNGKEFCQVSNKR